MKSNIETPVKFALVVVIWLIWWWAAVAQLSQAADLAVLLGGPLLVFPMILAACRLLGKDPSAGRTSWMTMFVHYAVGILLGVPIARAIVTYPDWPAMILPVPRPVGLLLLLLTGAVTLLTMLNLALKGLGAPFAIALSQKVASEWMYAWTRNPMALAGLAFLVSLGIWFQSWLFVLWALLLVSPALLFFIKVYEERELEARFGASYLEYKSHTPFLFTRKPQRS
jgi:protein-S-isoprenylcysteine O-methyltransferase Ste14